MINVGIAQISNTTSIEENFKSIKNLLNQFEKTDSDLVLFPECSLSGFTAKMKDCTLEVLNPYIDEIQNWANTFDIEVVLPSAFVENDKVYNSGFWFKKNDYHQFYKLGLTESEKKFFSTPNFDTKKVFQVGDYRFGILICFEAEHSPWKYFSNGSVDAILWPGYWGWTQENKWELNRDDDRLNPIYQNMAEWKCPLLQSNFAKNNLDNHKGSGPEGLSFIINADNKLVHRGAHLREDGFIVRMNKKDGKVSIVDIQSVL